jgi:hypothetical protein
MRMRRRGLRATRVKSIGMEASQELRERVYSRGNAAKPENASHRSAAGRVRAERK